MWDTISQVLRVLFDKKLIPTIVSIVVAIISVLLLPDDYWMIGKIGQKFFMLLVAGIVFLIISFIRWLFSVLQERLYLSNLRKEREANQRSDLFRQMDELWTEVDELSLEDRRLLRNFINNENAPITQPLGNRYGGLLDSSWVVSTEEYEQGSIKYTGQEMNNNGCVPKQIARPSQMIVKKYKLKDDIYQILKESIDIYGKISHFD